MTGALEQRAEARELGLQERRLEVLLRQVADLHHVLRAVVVVVVVVVVRSALVRRLLRGGGGGGRVVLRLLLRVLVLGGRVGGEGLRWLLV